MIYALHFATNIVREIYLGIALGDHASFRVDEFAGLHPDLFEKKGYGWHINNNPGASMIGSIPYFFNKWWIHRIVQNEQAKRVGSEPPHYDSPWPMARDFYAQAWRRGLDLKLGLAAMVMQIFGMAPLSALGVVLMFRVFKNIFASERTALWLSLLYAFGTPIFFRTGTLNQNLLTAHTIFAGFLLIWNPAEMIPWSLRTRTFFAGLAGGICILLDYSGVVLFLILLVYCCLKNKYFKTLLTYCCGSLPAIALLCFYQWKSFGNLFYPPQYHMPALNPYAETGFHGYVGIQPHLLWALLFDYRYGLFLSCPILLLSFALFGIRKDTIPKLEKWFLFIFFAAMWIFFSGVNYTNLQFNTGIRYLVAIIPFLFIAAAIVLLALPRVLAISLGILSVIQAWCLAMYRDVERGAGIAEPLIRIFREGPQLPALTTLSRMEGFKDWPYTVLVLGIFLVVASLLYFVWKNPRGLKPAINNAG